MKVIFPIVLCSSSLLVQAAEVTINAADIPAGDYSLIPFTTADGKVSITESTGNWSRGGNSPTSFGGSGLSGNANAFDQDDLGTLTVGFDSTSALRTFSTIWSSSSVTITGFLFDPGVTVTGGVGATASYQDGVVTLSQPWNANTIIAYNFAAPAASAGQNLNFSFSPTAGSDATNYQLAVNQIIYDDAPASAAPVIASPLPDSSEAVLGLVNSLSVGLSPETFPAATFAWEYLDGDDITLLSTDPVYQFTPSESDAGTYRVTVTNSLGSASSSTEVAVITDEDQLDNQWEVDFFGDITTYDGDDDVESDGLTNAEEFALGTDPTLADTDGDGLEDGAETNTGIFTGISDTGTDPLGDSDSDGDGWLDSFEVLNGATSPFDPLEPAVPGLPGFAIAFDATTGAAGSTNVPFTGLIGAGVPEVAQRNWNRTFNIDNPRALVTGGAETIATPNPGILVNSQGAELGDGISGVGFTYSGGGGAYSYLADPDTPYGRLFNTFLYGNVAAPEARVNLTGIPYSTYDVYVYFGSDSNGRRGLVTSPTTGQTFSFTTASNSTVATGVGAVYVRTTDTELAYPPANYARFENQTSANFEVFTTWSAPGGNLGIFGVQVVDTSGSFIFQLSNIRRDADGLSIDFSTSSGGTFILERSETLNGDWIEVGDPFTTGIGTSPVSDSSPPAGKAFYRVRRQ